MTSQAQLSKYYFQNKTAPGALAGPDKLAKGLERAGKNISAKAQQKLFATDPVLRQYYGTTRPKKEHESRMVAHFPLQRLHTDMADFTREVGGSNAKYLLVVICNYSRYAFGAVLKNRTTASLIRGYDEILKAVKKFRIFPFQKKNSVLIGDLEFKNKHLVAHLKTKHESTRLITISSSASKAFMAEQLIKTFRNKLALIKARGMVSFEKAGGWSAFVKQIFRVYNETYQKKIKRSPAEAIWMPQSMVGDQARNVTNQNFSEWKRGVKKIYRNRAKKYLHQYVRLVLIRPKTFSKMSMSKRIGRELYIVTFVR